MTAKKVKSIKALIERLEETKYGGIETQLETAIWIEVLTWLIEPVLQVEVATEDGSEVRQMTLFELLRLPGGARDAMERLNALLLLHKLYTTPRAELADAHYKTEAANLRSAKASKHRDDDFLSLMQALTMSADKPRKAHKDSTGEPEA